jgi:hypothetical protein
MLRLSIYIVIGFILVGIFWYFAPHIIIRISGHTSDLASLKELGPFGDSYGVVNSLFTGLALAAIVSAIVIQTQQLKKQNESLELQRGQLQQEEEWRRLQLQFDLLPNICRRAEFRLRHLCGDLIDIDKDFYGSPEGIQRLLDQFDRRIDERAHIISMHKTTVDELKVLHSERMDEIKSLSESGRAELMGKVLKGEISDPKYVDSLRDNEHKLHQEERVQAVLNEGRSIVVGIRGHQERLDATYERAVRLQSDLKSLIQ